LLFHRFLAYSEKKVSFVFFFHPTSIHTRPMPHFLENCTVQRSTNKHTYVVCRPEHICHLFFHTKMLVCLPEIQNFAPAYIHTRPMPHFLKNCTVKRSETRHTYVVCRRRQSYILCFCIKNLVFLPEIQNFATAYIHTRPMPHFLENCTVQTSENNHTHVVCRPEHICHLFFRTKMLVFLPEIQNFATAYIHTRPMPQFLRILVMKIYQKNHTYVVCRRKQAYILCFCIKNIFFLPEIQNFAPAYIHTRPMLQFLENCAVQRSETRHTYVVCCSEHICHLCFCIKNIFFLPEIQNFAPAYIHTRPMSQFLRILVMKIYQKNHTYVVCRHTHICYLFFRTKMLVFLPRV
jgi:hypothetical protein